MANKNLRRVSVVITAQTKGHLEHIAAACGYAEIGKVIDKLVREKMIALHETERKSVCHGRRLPPTPLP